MMQWLMHNEWWFALFIVLARVVDVSLGTMRTISVVRGYRFLAAGLGFLEVIVWVVAVSGVLVELTVIKVIAYGLGFALGNAVGVALEQRLALGQQLILLVSRDRFHDVAFALRLAKFLVTEIPARGGKGEVALSFVVVPRRHTPQVVQIARGVDPDAFITIQDIRGSSLRLRPTSVPATGWRAWMKKK